MGIRILAGLLASFALALPAGAQDHQHPPAAPQSKPPEQHQHTTAAEQDEHAQHLTHQGLFPARDASGTAWLPEASPMYALHGRVGAWELMWHGNAFLQVLHEEAAGDRGATQAGSINWIMGMARRSAGSGRVGARAMFSLEAATIGDCGYPDLLATGELCDGESIHDRQHPHDFLMELAVDYERPLPDGLRLQLYAGLAGEPALGPAAYPHRLSAMPNPLAPIGHHWFDATHITYGVVTAGIGRPKWKAETSLFNGREPDEDRWDIDLAAMDSFAARLWLAPSPAFAIQVSAGHLNDAEAEGGGGMRVDVDRVTASASYHRQSGPGSYLAAMAAWGRNMEHGEATHALLLEGNLTRNDRHTVFGRFELAGKTAHDLHVDGSDDIFTVGKLQVGYTRYLAPRLGLSAGIGGAVSASVVPASLTPHYGSRVNPGLAVFLTVRPGAHAM